MALGQKININLPPKDWHVMGMGSLGQAGTPQYDRFRSFAERYLAARAAGFTVGKELEEGWQAIQDAKKLYQMIGRASVDAEPDLRQRVEAELNATQQGVAQGPPPNLYLQIGGLNPTDPPNKQLNEAIEIHRHYLTAGASPPPALMSLIHKLMTVVGVSKFVTPAGAINGPQKTNPKYTTKAF